MSDGFVWFFWGLSQTMGVKFSCKLATFKGDLDHGQIVRPVVLMSVFWGCLVSKVARFLRFFEGNQKDGNSGLLGLKGNQHQGTPVFAGFEGKPKGRYPGFAGFCGKPKRKLPWSWF